jgi:hypothetical protein
VKSTPESGQCQFDDDQDYPVSRSFFPERTWFRATPRRPQCCPHLVATPFARDQELDELRQELVGWKGMAGYWQGRCAKAEAELESILRKLGSQQGRITEYKGVDLDACA